MSYEDNRELLIACVRAIKATIEAAHNKLTTKQLNDDEGNVILTVDGLQYVISVALDGVEVIIDVEPHEATSVPCCGGKKLTYSTYNEIINIRRNDGEEVDPELMIFLNKYGISTKRTQPSQLITFKELALKYGTVDLAAEFDESD